MLDEMCALLGGRAAEEVIFSQISTGALSDLERTTKMAQAMVTIYGLNDKLGNISYYDSSGQQNFFMDKPYSDDTAKLIDKEISILVESQYERAKKILSENKDKLDKLAEKLLEKEVIFRDDLEEVFGKRPFDSDSSSSNDASNISAEMKSNASSKNNQNAQEVEEIDSAFKAEDGENQSEPKNNADDVDSEEPTEKETENPE